MELVVEELDQLKRKLDITIPEEIVTERIDNAYKELNRQMKMPGFRSGKIPRKILEKQLTETVEQIVNLGADVWIIEQPPELGPYRLPPRRGIGVIRVKELWICLATQAGIFTGYIRIDGKFFFIKVLIEELFSESKDIGVHIFTTFLKLLS